jgi:hypothetical protein
VRDPRFERALVGARLWTLALLVGLAVAGSLVGCRKNAPDNSNPALTGDAVKQSLADLKNRLDELKKKFMALREQVDAIPPDMPGFGDVRVRFYATEEGRGTTDGKSVWLASQLEAAVKSGNRAELEQVSKDIAATYDDIRKIDELHVKLLHQVMAFERMAHQAQAAEKQAAKEAAATPIAKSPRAKSRPAKP